MGLPVIKVDSTAGAKSDTACSGAGPATAVTGANGRTRNASGQLRVGFFESSAPDLSGVATDGTHVLYIASGTGERKFSAITGTVKNTAQVITGNMTSGSAVLSNLSSTSGWTVGDVLRVSGAGAASSDLYSTIKTIDSSTQVTLDDNAGTSVTGNGVKCPCQVSLVSGQGINAGAGDCTWAIGGVRATVFGTNSTPLWTNNSGNGDMMPGWTCEMQSGHTETVSASQTLKRGGDTTGGSIMLIGKSGAGTMPILTWSNNGSAIVPDCQGDTGRPYFFANFEARNSSVTKSSAVLFSNSGGYSIYQTYGIVCNHATDYFQTYALLSQYQLVGHIACKIAVSGTAVDGAGGAGNTPVRILGCYIKGGVHALVGNAAWVVIGNIFDGQSGYVMEPYGQNVIFGNTFYNAGGDGITASTNNGSNWLSIVANNLFVNCTGKGLDSYGASAFFPFPLGAGLMGNAFYNNSGGDFNPSSLTPIRNTTGTNPSFTNAGSGDFSIGTALKGVAWPASIGSTNDYVDPGAAQRQEPAGGGGALVRGGLVG